MKRIYIFIFAGAVILAAGLFFAIPIVEKTLYIGDKPHKADAIIVLSGDTDPYYLRTKKAVELYKQGYARYIIFSGYGAGGDNAEFLAKIALHYNISKQAIIIEPNARTTYENFFFAKPIILKHNFKSIIIVTSPYHQLRSYLVAKKLFAGTGVSIYNCASSRPEIRIRDIRSVLMEYFKLLGYYMLGRV